MWVNGKEVGSHRGGYDSFTFDITDALKKSGLQEIILSVWDPTNAGSQPRGKQVKKPGGIWYTAVTGIWQTVWLEPVPKKYVRRIRIVPLYDEGVVQIEIDATGGTSVAASVIEDEGPWASVQPIDEREPIRIKLQKLRAWSPSDPFLYDVVVRLYDKGGVIDQVQSYFGMRKIEVKKDKAGINRLFLNNKPLFQYGPLDQGWWPDGLYTAPTDEALRYDIEVLKKIGCNMLRKHVKIEPARFYYWCDKLGLMVWQDMPNGNNKTDADKKQFEWELMRLVHSHYNNPSIIMWVPFNEGWGQHDTPRYAELIKKLDPTRLVNEASGWANRESGDVRDIHSYPGPAAPPNEEKRASVLGEFGGLGLPVKGHTWQDEKNWGYRSYETREQLTNSYVALLSKLRPMIGGGLCAAVYTQTTDVEVEVNGFMTYDRAMVKMDAKRIAAANRKLYLPPPVIKTIVPTAQNTSELPPVKPLFDFPVRDTSVCVGPDGIYYLTGTTANNPAGIDDKTGWYYVNEGIRVWKSKDLKEWEPLGLVWSVDKDATWAKEFKTYRGNRARAVWAPEIHYLKGTFWLTYSMNYRGCGLLKSVTGKPEGPYRDVKTDGPLTGQIDASLFQDDDGKVYWVYQNGKIARMKDDMTGLAKEPRLLKPANYKHVGFEGAFVMKSGGRYHLACADFIGGNYHCMVASSASLMGPYGDRYLAVPHGGHNMFFRDREGRWWSTLFGHTSAAPVRERPAILRVAIDNKGKIAPLFPPGFEKQEPPKWRYTMDPPGKGWETADFDDAAWSQGPAGFGKAGTPGALVRTEWNSSDIWLRRAFELKDKKLNELHLSIHHDEDAEVYINGVLAAKLSGYTTSYVKAPIEEAASKALKVGSNCLAVHCHQSGGGQYIDVGMVNVTEQSVK